MVKHYNSTDVNNDQGSLVTVFKYNLKLVNHFFLTWDRSISSMINVSAAVMLNHGETRRGGRESGTEKGRQRLRGRNTRSTALNCNSFTITQRCALFHTLCS